MSAVQPHLEDIARMGRALGMQTAARMLIQQARSFAKAGLTESANALAEAADVINAKAEALFHGTAQPAPPEEPL